MTTQAKLTDTQTTILKAASGHPDGNVEPLLANLRGGARAKVIEGLRSRAPVAAADGNPHQYWRDRRKGKGQSIVWPLEKGGAYYRTTCYWGQ